MSRARTYHRAEDGLLRIKATLDHCSNDRKMRADDEKYEGDSGKKIGCPGILPGDFAGSKYESDKTDIVAVNAVRTRLRKGCEDPLDKDRL